MGEMININEVANKYQIASLKLWSLIRNKRINAVSNYSCTLVNAEEVEKYFKKNPLLLKEWQLLHISAL